MARNITGIEWPTHKRKASQRKRNRRNGIVKYVADTTSTQRKTTNWKDN